MMLKREYQGFICPVIWLLLSVFGTISCTNKLHSSKVDEATLYPASPDTAKFQLLTTINSSKDVIRKRSVLERYVIGDEEVMAIQKPYGMSMHKGKLFVCDLALAGLEIIDLEKGTFEYFVPEGKGKFIRPVGCFVDEMGYLYVADPVKKELLIFDERRKYVGNIGKEEGIVPIDVYVTKEAIWVVSVKEKVYVYSKEDGYKLIRAFPDGFEKGQEGFLYQSKGISVTDSAVYVSDFIEANVKVYSHEGEYKRAIGKTGTAYGQFVRPKGIALDREENIYVVDAAFANVQVFNKDDELLMFFGGHEEPGAIHLPYSVIVDYEHVAYFEKFVDKRYELKYLILLSNTMGNNKINVYGRIELKEKMHEVEEKETTASVN